MPHAAAKRALSTCSSSAEDELERDAGSSANPGRASASASKRPKTGCITCRLRKKRCDETKPFCTTCERLELECLGYGDKRPVSVRGEAGKRARLEIKRRLLDKRKSDAEVRKRIRVNNSWDGSPTASASVSVSARSSGGNSAAPSPAREKKGPHGGPQLPSESEDSLSSPIQDGRRRSTSLDLMAEAASVHASGLAMSESFYDLHGSAWARACDGSAGPSVAPLRQISGSGPLSTANLQYLPTPIPLGTASPQLWAQSPPDAHANLDPALSELRTYLLGSQPLTHSPSSDSPSPTIPHYTDLPASSSASSSDPYAYPLSHLVNPSPPRPLSLPLFPDLNVGPPPIPSDPYLAHYFNHVLPQQYRLAHPDSTRFFHTSFMPLAIAHPGARAAMASLAMLHLFSRRIATSPALAEHDLQVATRTHHQSLQSLRLGVAAGGGQGWDAMTREMAEDAVAVQAVSAISFALFCGGTSSGWVEALGFARQCLRVALQASPELTDPDGLTNSSRQGSTPWQRHRTLIQAMIRVDITASITERAPTRLLPVYRNLLAWAPEGARRAVAPSWVGISGTTLLVIAEIVALSAWRDQEDALGQLDVEELVSRARDIERLLDEQDLRHGGTRGRDPRYVDNTPDDEAARSDAMGKVFDQGARVFLASVVNGPNPRVPKIITAVRSTISALRHLDTLCPDPDLRRGLIFPITVAACHVAAEDVAAQAFFRGLYTGLGDEAKRFGNTMSALALMEEVWRRRREGRGRVEWREIMGQMGWEAGILLV